MKKSILSALATMTFVILSPTALAAGPYIYVGNAGEDTVSKIDVSIPAEVARYATWFTSGVNSFTCNPAVTPSPVPYGSPCNYPIPHSGGDKSHEGPAPSRIARDSTGTNGYVYVLNRFFSTADAWTGSVNGPHFPVLLKIAVNPSGVTSSGSTVLPIIDGNNSNDIDTGEAGDQAIAWAHSIGTGADLTGLGRALAVDKNGFLWVGIYKTHMYYKVDPNTGMSTGVSVSTGTHTPYACQIDVNGHLWSVDEKSSLAEIDTSAATPYLVGVYTHSDMNYSLSVYNDCSSSPPKVKVYISNQSGRTWICYDPQAPPTSRFSYGPSISSWPSYAIGVDKAGNIISGFKNGQVIKANPAGTVLWNNSSVTMTDLHGLIMDDNGDPWAVDRYGNQVVRYSVGSGTTTAADKVKVGLEPYTYGNTPPAGCTNVSPTPTPTPTPSPTPTPTAIPGCAQITGEAHCLRDGNYSYTLSVTNNSGNPASQILLTPAQGSTFTLGPQLVNLSSPLNSGQSTSITTTIGHANPGDKVCFFVSLMSEKAQCCIVQVCLTLPNCGDVTPTPTPTATASLPPPPARQLPRGRRRP